MSSSSDSPVPDPSRLDHIETRWSLLRRSSGAVSGDVAMARQTLVLRYASAIRGYCRAILGSDADADEMSQDVVVRLLQGDFAGADPQRGRFRDLLRTAIRNMARNRWSRENRRTGASALDDDRFADPEAEAVDDPWLPQWRATLLENTWEELRRYQESQPNSCFHTVLRSRTDFPEATSEQLAAKVSEQLGREVNAASVRQNLRRSRVKYCELLVEEVADGLDHPTRDRVQEELIALDLWSSVKDMLPDDWRPQARP
ncbi:MAG: sigma factor [Pirellulaceae bacterium]|nr:sigma-70 family RNA polymerase sigma factor [Planctomycetales bacterium]